MANDADRFVKQIYTDRSIPQIIGPAHSALLGVGAVD